MRCIPFRKTLSNYVIISLFWWPSSLHPVRPPHTAPPDTAHSWVAWSLKRLLAFCFSVQRLRSRSRPSRSESPWVARSGHAWLGLLRTNSGVFIRLRGVGLSKKLGRIRREEAGSNLRPTLGREIEHPAPPQSADWWAGQPPSRCLRSVFFKEFEPRLLALNGGSALQEATPSTPSGSHPARAEFLVLWAPVGRFKKGLRPKLMRPSYLAHDLGWLVSLVSGTTCLCPGSSPLPPPGLPRSEFPQRLTQRWVRWLLSLLRTSLLPESSSSPTHLGPVGPSC